MSECGHVLKKENRVCTRKSGHDGRHVTHNDEGASVFRVYEWTDDQKSRYDLKELGRIFPCDYDLGYDERQKTMAIAIFDARRELNTGDVFEIRARWKPVQAFVDYGRILQTKREGALRWGVAWYHVPLIEGFEDLATPSEPLFEKDINKGEENRLGGYVLVARIKV